ncbi:hypothetical protein ACLOJK_037491 [Asimina triloba]
MQGLVQVVSVSNYGPKQLLKIYNYLKVDGVPLCSTQCHSIYAYLELAELSNCWIQLVAMFECFNGGNEETMMD